MALLGALAVLLLASAAVAQPQPPWLDLDPYETLVNSISSAQSTSWHHFQNSYRGPEPGCWEGSSYSFKECCASRLQMDSSSYAIEYLPPGTPGCFDEVFTFARCCAGLGPAEFDGGALSPIGGFKGERPGFRSPPQKCPEGTAAFVVAGEVLGDEVEEPPDRLWLALKPYRYANLRDVLIGEDVLPRSPVTRELNQRVTGRVTFLGDNMHVTPGGEGAVLTYSLCARLGPCPEGHGQGPCPSKGATLLAESLFAPLWGNFTLTAVVEAQKLLEKRKEKDDLSQQSLRDHGELLGGFWLLEARILEDGFKIKFYPESDVRPICEVSPDRLECEWSLLPYWALAVFVACVLPGFVLVRGSLQTLLQETPGAADVLDLWHVVLGAMVVCSNSVRASSPALPWLVDLATLANSLAFALSIRLQDAPDYLSDHVGGRWTRAPARLALVAIKLLALRGLLTLDLTPRANFARERPHFQQQALQAFTDDCDRVVYHFEHSWMGPIAELVEPPWNWPKAVRPVAGTCSANWLFRAEAMLWILVMFCRELGVLGWMLLVCACSLVLTVLADAGQGPELAGSAGDLLPAIWQGFPAAAAGYITASAWRQVSVGQSWRLPTAVALLAVAAALCTALRGDGGALGPEVATVLREKRCLLAGVCLCFGISGIEGILDVGVETWAQAPAPMRQALRILARLSYGVCLLHRDFVLDWIWGPFRGLRRAEAPLWGLVLVWFLANLLALVLWVFVQQPASQALERLCTSLCGEEEDREEMGPGEEAAGQGKLSAEEFPSSGCALDTKAAVGGTDTDFDKLEQAEAKPDVPASPPASPGGKRKQKAGDAPASPPAPPPFPCLPQDELDAPDSPLASPGSKRKQKGGGAARRRQGL